MKLENAKLITENLFGGMGFQIAINHLGKWISVDKNGGGGKPEIYDSKEEAVAAFNRIKKLKPYGEFKIVSDNSEFKD